MATGKTNEYTKPGLTGLVFIEPQRAPIATEDTTTQATRELVKGLSQSTYSYKGAHSCSCGVRSDSKDHYYTPPGRNKPTHITTSLLLHYVEFHRAEIPAEDLAELEKVLKLHSGEMVLAQPSNARNHKVVWVDDCNVADGSPLRRGTYEQCVEYLRQNWQALKASKMAKHWELNILDPTGRFCSYVIR
jgi:hypothetical protein